MHSQERPFVAYLFGFLVFGALGAGIFQAGACVAKDLLFLHAARVTVEQQIKQLPPVTPAPK